MLQTFAVISLVYFRRFPKPFSMVTERRQRERRGGGGGKRRKERRGEKGRREEGMEGGVVVGWEVP